MLPGPTPSQEPSPDSHRRGYRVLSALALGVVALLLVPLTPAVAVGPVHQSVVSPSPSTLTPNIDDGRVLSMVKVGNRIVVGGTFTSVTNRTGGASYARKSIFSFDPATGQVDPAFAPSINGTVAALLPGTGSQVYAGGTFTTVNGATHRNLTLLNTTNGALVPGFKAAAMNGAVNDMGMVGGKLYVGGTFNTVNNVPHSGLTTLSPTSGLLDAYMSIDVAVNHNWNGTGARAGVGVSKFDITPDGTRLVAIGNFKLVEGESRDQAVIILLQPGTPVVDPNWRTTRYVPACFRNSFDSYVRDIDIAPDGSWFSVVATGGPNPGTLCDTATRWEFTDTGTDVQPRWIADSGGDTLFSVAVTGTALYVGGHQRWMNNAGASDRAGQGSVPRPGLAALDVLNGVPLSWNPGRQPRGVGAQALLVTADGLYVGSDTDYIGNVQYLRGKIAYFPLAGGSAPASQDTGTLPANVFLAGRQVATGSPVTGVLHRVNAAGPALASLDGGPAWAEDTAGNPSPRHNSGNSTADYAPVPAVDGTVPGSTPSAVFTNERWDPGAKNDGQEMSWSFPVTAGTPIAVRLYFANRYSGTSNPGQRVYDVSIDGVKVLDNFDIRAGTPDQTGTMRSFTSTSDGTVNIDFGHELENPLVNAIEIIDTSVPPNPGPGPIGTNDLITRYVAGTDVSDTSILANPGAIEWSRMRGGFLVGGQLVFGWSDGNLYRRSYDGTTFGAATLIDPYNDPFWSTIQTGSGQTYRGVKPTFYGQLPSVTGLFYSGGRLYYTLSGQQALYYRGFSTDSMIVEPVERVVPGSTGWSSVLGMFVSGNGIYWGSNTDGNLRRMDFVNGVPTGAATVLSGPTLDGTDWRTRAMFLGPGDPPPPNQPPTAAFTSSCIDLTCTFDAGDSADADGSIIGYAWTFGDTTSGSGETTNHLYGTAGPRTVTLTVTDDDGGTASVNAQVTPGVTNVAPVAAFTVDCDGRTCVFDGSGSSDSDGTVTGYAWTFGDGGTAAIAQPSHTYAEAGSYPVTLTVTDNLGATGERSQPQSVNANRIVRFRAAAGPFSGSGATSAAVTVPASVQAGDALVLVLSTNSAVTGTAPAGYTVVGTQTANTAITTRVFQRVATAGDAGTTVTVGLSGPAKTTLTLVAYSGTSPASPVSTFAGASDSGGTSHLTPTVAAPADALVVSVWTDKSAVARSFTAPAGVSVRTTINGGGTGDLAVLFADGGTPVPAGQVGGLTATVGAASARATMLTLLLAPAT